MITRQRGDTYNGGAVSDEKRVGIPADERQGRDGEETISVRKETHGENGRSGEERRGEERKLTVAMCERVCVCWKIV